MKRVSFVMLSALASVMAMAQNGGGADLNVNVTKSGGDASGGFPWMWVIIGVVVLIVLIALLSGGGSSRTTNRTTIIKEKS